MGWLDILSPLSGVVNLVNDRFKESAARKQAKLESDLAVSAALTASKIEMIKTQQAADIAWENTQIANAGWKDDWLTILVSIPLVLAFIPAAVPMLREGFAALELMPDWYKIAVGTVFSAAFGVKQLVNFMQYKKGA